MDFKINELRVDDTLLLDESSDEVQEIYNIKSIFDNSKEVSGKYYKDEYKSYKDVIDCLSSYIKENGMNILESIGFLSYVVHRGRLSFDRCYFEFDDDVQYEEELIGYSGAQVLTGRGCCRHLSNFFKDVLSLCGFDVQYILNDIYEIDGSPFTFCSQVFGYHLELREVHEEDSEYVKGKHACIMINYNGRYLVYDPTNLSILYVDDLKAFSLGGVDSMKINLSPSSLVLYDEFTYPEMVEFMNKIRNNRREIYGNEEFRIIDTIIKGISMGKVIPPDFETRLNEMVNQYREYRLARLDGSIHLKYLND